MDYSNEKKEEYLKCGRCGFETPTNLSYDERLELLRKHSCTGPRDKYDEGGSPPARSNRYARY